MKRITNSFYEGVRLFILTINFGILNCKKIMAGRNSMIKMIKNLF